MDKNIGTNTCSCLSEYMNTYKHQRSRSLFDSCPKSFRFILSNMCSQAAGHIKSYTIWSPYDQEPRWPPCQYIFKSFRNFLLWNQMAKIVTLDDLHFFNRKVKFACRKKAWKLDYLGLRSQVSVTRPLVLWFKQGGHCPCYTGSLHIS